KRLQHVQIESLPYQEILRRYDRPSTVFYCDPPYWNRKLYRHNLAPKDFEELQTHLIRIRWKVILSLDNHPEIRRIFREWRLLSIDVAYTAQRKVGKRYGELLIMNFSPKR